MYGFFREVRGRCKLLTSERLACLSGVAWTKGDDMNEVKLKTSFLLIIFFILHATCHSAVPSEAIKIEFSNLARIIPWERSAISQANGGISLFTGRDSIESSDRWMDILVKLENKDIPVERTSLLVTVNDMESRLPALHPQGSDPTGPL